MNLGIRLNLIGVRIERDMTLGRITRNDEVEREKNIQRIFLWIKYNRKNWRLTNGVHW